MIKTNSIIIHIIRFIFIFMSLLVFLLAIIWANTRNVMKENIIESMKSAQILYKKDIEENLLNADRSINTVINNIDDVYMLGSDDENVRYHTSIRIKAILDKAKINNRDLGTLVVYSKKHQVYLAYEDNLLDLYQKMEIRQSIVEMAEDKEKEIYKWQVIRAGREYFALRVLENEESLICAAIRIDILFQNLLFSASDKRFLYSLSYSGILIAGDMRKHSHFFTLEEPLSGSDISLLVSINKENMFGGLQLIQVGVFLLILFSLAYLLVFARFMNRQLFHPLKDLKFAMKQIEEGDFEYQIDNIPFNLEMRDVTNSFNFMIREILSLKIRTYEETIAHQSSELKYLQSQIKPHFVLNAISTIHSMTYKKNNEVIRNYIDALSRHIRYLFKMKFQLVPLESELNHIQNYFKMQDILYPDCVMYYIDMDEDACEWLIPPLLLHTIMENEYKYAVSFDNLLSIFITGKLIMEGGERMLHLVIEDDGVGFSSSSLERVNSPNIDFREDGTGMGIRNLHAMMRMFFNRTDLLRFSNRENSGARVDIGIPAEILGDKEK